MSGGDPTGRRPATDRGRITVSLRADLIDSDHAMRVLGVVRAGRRC